MIINISKNAAELGEQAAHLVAQKLKEAIRQNGDARMVVSTGASQFETFQALLKEELEWQKIEVFHLDEYIGLPITHEASFRKYLNDRFISHIRIKKFYSVDVENDIHKKIKDLTKEIRRKTIDVGLIGIGVNGHIAFNDPPADFNTREAYIIVNLDEQCRLQQVNEGWFKTIEDVPSQAVSMTPWQIMQCRTIISCVPHKVKAISVRNTLVNKLTEVVPATILKQHQDYHLYLDFNSASEIIPI
jgi:glucosamine-6-phosphate deaminase